MKSTGRLSGHASQIRNPAATARLLSQNATAAQENLFSIAVDKNDNISSCIATGYFDSPSVSNVLCHCQGTPAENLAGGGGYTRTHRQCLDE